LFRVRYELQFHIQEDGILHTYRRENVKSYIALTYCALYQRRNASAVRYELSFYMPGDGILHSHRRGSLRSCNAKLIPRLNN
jgi:hypothetical protein